MKWLVLLLLVPLAGAYAESDAPGLDPRVASVSHAPAVPEPGTQWTGTISFVPGHNVTSVRYQICNVGTACFAGPTPADQVDENTWAFDTADYGPGGQAVEWGIYYPGDSTDDWLVGVKYFLYTDGETDVNEGHAFPEGVEYNSPECESMEWIDCDATHYFTFPLPAAAAPMKESPGLPWLAAVALLVVLARRR